MIDYRIETLRHAVVVVLRDGRRVPGDVFLRSQARLHPGPEEPLDHFNDETPFFALSCRDSDEVLLVAKAQVALVELAPDPADAGFEVPHVGLNIELELEDTRTISGCVFPETREDRARLLDFLNQYAPAFLAIFAPDRTILVNRRTIASVKQLS